jgi:hypothetical protein
MAQMLYSPDSTEVDEYIQDAILLAENRIRADPQHPSPEERAIGYDLGYKQGLADKLENHRIDTSFWATGSYLALGTTGWVQVSAEICLPVFSKEPQCACLSSLELRSKTRQWGVGKLHKSSISRCVCQCDCQRCIDNGCGSNVCKLRDHCQSNKAFIQGINPGYKRKANCHKCKEIRAVRAKELQK